MKKKLLSGALIVTAIFSFALSTSAEEVNPNWEGRCTAPPPLGHCIAPPW